MKALVPKEKMFPYLNYILIEANFMCWTGTNAG